ncbi:hypothetical protein COV19_02825 [Candidatus Woesearchaeota archaeon CG10_big_fil_rev_8_21_14_0_10_44_13]|nr:MAG: hypothetical protein COV19_02825 [Candidatus Woesearchaeota archaeon CG10_big_fil_rev_8_21_14_0_10_44_13]
MKRYLLIFLFSFSLIFLYSVSTACGQASILTGYFIVENPDDQANIDKSGNDSGPDEGGMGIGSASEDPAYNDSASKDIPNEKGLTALTGSVTSIDNDEKGEQEQGNERGQEGRQGLMMALFTRLISLFKGLFDIF